METAPHDSLICKVTSHYMDPSHKDVFDNFFLFSLWTPIRSCPPAEQARCVVARTGESRTFCYTHEPSPKPSTPALCKPLNTSLHTALSGDLPAKELKKHCELALVSAAVWNTGDPLTVIVAIGTYALRSATDFLPVSLTTPSGVVHSLIMADWQSVSWSLPGDDLPTTGPPDWVVVLNSSRCDKRAAFFPFRSVGILSFSLSHELGNYTLLLGNRSLTNFSFDPLIRNADSLRHAAFPVVGSHVLKMNVQESVLIQPQVSLKKVVVSLHGLNTSAIVPYCESYLQPSISGWNAWVQLWQGSSKPLNRPKRAMADWLAPVGAGASLIDAANIEILANKLSYATSDVSKLGDPITHSLNTLAENHHSVSDILLSWQNLVTTDFKSLTKAIISLQSNVSKSLACSQAHSLNLAFIMNLVRDAYNGHLPLEIKQLMLPSLSPQERALDRWWSLLNSTFDPKVETLTLFVSTATAQSLFSVYPAVPLGLQTGTGDVLYAKDTTTWARFVNSRWQTIDLSSCQHRQNLGFLCPSPDLPVHHPCLAPIRNSSHICHYDVYQENSSVVLYVGRGCVCVRTRCPMVFINSDRFQPMLPLLNRCFCNVSSISGCDFSFSVPHWTYQDITLKPALYHSLTPVFLGLGLEVLLDLLTHPQLVKQLEEIKTAGTAAVLSVSHNGAAISKLASSIESAGQHSWWESLFGWSPTATSFFNLALHPIVVILAFQVILCIVLFVLICWVKRRIGIIQSSLDQNFKVTLVPNGQQPLLTH